MLKDLQSIFKNTWDAFRREVERREPEDQVADLLRMMRREMVEARALLPELDAEIQRVRRDLEVERKALADTERRRGLAERIKDEETVRVATEFAERHAARVRVLEQKLQAAQAERELRGREVEEMTRRYQQADTQRFALLAELRRVQARGRLDEALGEGGASSDPFSRMREKVERQAAYADALEELEGIDTPPGSPPPSAAEREREVEERLRELKRRMGQE